MSEASFSPALLLAMPQLLDPNFERAVVLLCKYEEEGALGFIVNRPLGTLASQVVQFDPPIESPSPLTVFEGGPVSPERGWLLCRGSARDDDGLRIADGVHMSNSQSFLRQVLESPHAMARPQQSRLLLGYAGWGPGQLDRELSESAWLLAPLNVPLMFDTEPEALWETVIRGLGVDPRAIAPAPGIH